MKPPGLRDRKGLGTELYDVSEGDVTTQEDGHTRAEDANKGHDIHPYSLSQTLSKLVLLFHILHP